MNGVLCKDLKRIAVTAGRALPLDGSLRSVAYLKRYIVMPASIVQE